MRTEPRALKIAIVTTVPERSLTGNRGTAERWARRLAELGHEPRVLTSWDGGEDDLLLALHARKSAASVARWRRERGDAPLVVALTGTDLYRDLAAGDADARASLETADRLAVLQPLAIEALPAALRAKASVVIQSAEPPPDTPPPREDRFEICQLAHLRPIKDPLLGARAAARLPASSRIEIVHAGQALTPEAGAEARAEAAANPRYRWVGELPRGEALRLLARSRALLLASRHEGGATVVSEAAACGVPILASRIPGSVGLLGEDHPGFFPAGDAVALAGLLARFEADRDLREELAERSRRLGETVRPEREREALASVVDGLARFTGEPMAGA